MAKKRLEILTDVDRTAINKRIDDISTEYVFGFEETFVATANQVEFTLSKEFDKGMQAVDLYINGVKQPSSFFTEVNNKTIKTKKPIAQGDIVNIKAYKSKKTTEVKVIEHKDSHISGNDQLPVATEDTKGLMAPEDKKKIKAIDMKADSALEKIAEHDTEIDNLKQSVSDGKKKVSVAITDKGVETAPDATFDVMATNISKIETDPSIGTTNAVAEDLLEGKKMVSQGELMTGTMPNRGALNKTLTTQNGKQIIAPGYYSGGEVKAQFNNLVPENIKEGVNVGGVVGSLQEGKAKTISGSITVPYDQHTVFKKSISLATLDFIPSEYIVFSFRDFSFAHRVGDVSGGRDAKVSIYLGNVLLTSMLMPMRSTRRQMYICSIYRNGSGKTVSDNFNASGVYSKPKVETSNNGAYLLDSLDSTDLRLELFKPGMDSYPGHTVLTDTQLSGVIHYK